MDQYNTDAGNGVKSDCSTNITRNDPNDAYVPLKDDPGGGDPAGRVYRHAWATALASAFGGAKHFYDMDNEIDIGGGAHRDIRPNPSGYEELRDIMLTLPATAGPVHVTAEGPFQLGHPVVIFTETAN